MADIDRGPVLLQGLLDGDHGAVHARAVATGGGEQDTAASRSSHATIVRAAPGAAEDRTVEQPGSAQKARRRATPRGAERATPMAPRPPAPRPPDEAQAPRPNAAALSVPAVTSRAHGSQHVRGRPAARRRGVTAHRGMDRPARRGVGRGADHPAVAAAGRGRRLPDAARPVVRHLRQRHLLSAGVRRGRRRGERGRARRRPREAGVVRAARAAVAAGRRDKAGGRRRTAGPAGAVEEGARRRGAVRARAQEGAALPAPAHRPGLRAGLRRRAGRAGERPAPLARRPLRGAQRRRAGRTRGAAGHPGGEGAGRARRRGRDHRDARRRQRGGPAAVLRRAARTGGRVLPYARGVGDRARAGQPAARLRGRPARVHPHRRGQEGRAGRGRGVRAGAVPSGPGAAQRPCPSSSARSAGWRTRWRGPR